MKLLKRLLVALVVIVVALILAAYLLPRQYRVQRSVVINARPDAVLGQVADLRAWKNWGAWQERDPGMKQLYSDPSVGVGAWSSWESKTEGNGKMTIREQTPAKIAYLLEFPDMGMKSDGTMELQPEGTGIRVTWVDAGDLGLNPLSRWFGLFLDGMIGPDFEKGLANLKRLAEK